MTDLVTFGETALRLSPPQHARLETADQLNVWATGAASNVAVAASRLGTDSTWASKLADTPLGRRAVSELRGHGITTDVSWVEASEARQGLTFFEAGSTPRDSYVLDDRHGTAIETAEPAELPMDDVQDGQAVFVSGETIALSETVEQTAQAVLRAAGGTSVLGLDYRPDLWSASEARETLTDMFPAADVLVANEDDVQTVLKQTGEASQLAHQIGSKYDFETVVVTQGEHGALVWHDATIHESDAVETQAVETTGEHDAFIGAFLSRRLAGDGISDALAHGVAAATLTRTIPGPVPTVTPDEVERIVDELDEGSPGNARGALR
ncbi:sugar kinase [Halorientalis brevis]|uniref:Sugar kinase n=1 Tax=Halorientalis brevis TaxID=1126241 RepID=A0ABD6CEB3_9EURY|nr:sugar kinase [Halorientalis brevis]